MKELPIYVRSRRFGGAEVDDLWILARLQLGDVTTLDLLNSFERYRRVTLTPLGVTNFKRFCNARLNYMAEYGLVEKTGKVFQHGSNYMSWIYTGPKEGEE